MREQDYIISTLNLVVKLKGQNGNSKFWIFHFGTNLILIINGSPVLFVVLENVALITIFSL